MEFMLGVKKKYYTRHNVLFASRLGIFSPYFLGVYQLKICTLFPELIKVN
jgi:hypothetical protein